MRQPELDGLVLRDVLVYARNATFRIAEHPGTIAIRVIAQGDARFGELLASKGLPGSADAIFIELWGYPETIAERVQEDGPDAE